MIDFFTEDLKVFPKESDGYDFFKTQDIKAGEKFMSCLLKVYEDGTVSQMNGEKNASLLKKNLTEYSFYKLCQLVGITRSTARNYISTDMFPSSYIEEPTRKLVELINTGLEGRRESDQEIKLLAGYGDVVLSVVSPRYSLFSNLEVIKSTSRLLGGTEYEFEQGVYYPENTELWLFYKGGEIQTSGGRFTQYLIFVNSMDTSKALKTFYGLYSESAHGMILITSYNFSYTIIHRMSDSNKENIDIRFGEAIEKSKGNMETIAAALPSLVFKKLSKSFYNSFIRKAEKVVGVRDFLIFVDNYKYFYPFSSKERVGVNSFDAQNQSVVELFKNVAIFANRYRISDRKKMESIQSLAGWILESNID